jgi:hypothetical protein
VGILKWADDHHRFTGSWPRTSSGPVRANLNEAWRRIDRALRAGDRGLPGGDSLPRLLARERGTRNHKALPPLSEEQILTWAKERIHGPTFVVEFLDVQPDGAGKPANHIHSSWRDLPGDFGLPRPGTSHFDFLPDFPAPRWGKPGGRKMTLQLSLSLSIDVSPVRSGTSENLEEKTASRHGGCFPFSETDFRRLSFEEAR